MTYQPVVPFGGVAGWAFFQRTMPVQREAFENSATVLRDTDYFRENIANASRASDLVDDRRLLAVALGAFGLSDDIDNKAFIETVLEDGVLKESALANKLTDKRYHDLAKSFGYGDFSVANTQLSDFSEGIVADYLDRSFEAAVGAQNQDIRLAMSVEREIEAVLSRDASDDGKWYAVMGSPPLRSVFEKALGLPASFAVIDIEQQLATFREKTERVFGNGEVSAFREQENREKLIRLYLVRSDATQQAIGGQSAALAILQASTLTPLS